MFKVVSRVFGLYSGEWSHAFRFARLSLFWAFGSACLETLSDGLFLDKIGPASLPTVYFTIALSLFIVSSIVLYSLRVTSPYRIMVVALSLGALICITTAFLVDSPLPDSFWYGLKIASRLFFSVMLATAWTFMDQYHDLQDAKRIYAIYGAAFFLGTILSGTAISLLLDFTGFAAIFALAACSIGFAIVEIHSIVRTVKAIPDDTVEGVLSGSRDTLPSLWQLVFRSRFVIVLLLLWLFNQLIWTTTEVNYMKSMALHLNGASKGQIAEFLGKCRASISFFNILIAAFIFSRAIRRAGVQNIVLITPLFYLFLYGAWVWHDSMTLAVLGLVAVDGIMYVIDDNCSNLLSNAVPAKLKSRVRILSASFCEPVGMLLSSTLLLCLDGASKWLGLVLVLATLTLTLIIRALYSQSILTNLKDNAVHFERKLQNWVSSWTRREQKEAKKDILQALSPNRAEEIQLLAIASLFQLNENPPQAIQAAQRLSVVSKIKYLRLLEKSSFGTDPQVIEMIDSWTDENESPELAKWAFLYLAKKGLQHPEKAEDDLDDPDLFLRGAAILTMKKSLANQSLDYAALNRTIAAKKLDLMLKSERIDEISLGLDILSEENHPEAFERALPFLSHDALLVKRAAGRCIAKLADRKQARFAPRLLDELESSRDNSFRLSILNALGKIADSTTTKEILLASVYFRPNERRKTEEILAFMGLKIVPLLLTLTKDISLPDRARILAGKILGRLALPQLQANLIDILDIEIERAYFYFYFGHTVQKQHPLYDLEMLQSALLTGYQSVIDFIIHLLGAAGSLEDPELLVRALHSRNAKIHSHAIESLEKTCDVRIFNLIAPLVDDLPLEEKMAACLRWQGDYPNLTLSELLSKLEQSQSLFDRIVAVRLKAKLQMPNWRQQLREQMKHSDETFHQFAYELLET